MKKSGWASLKILIRTDSDPLRIVVAVRGEIRAVIANIRTMEKIVSDSVAQRRFSILLLGLFAVVAVSGLD